MHGMKLLTLAAVLSTAFAGSAWAAGAADSISADQPYVRAVPPGQSTTAAFMVLKNADSKVHSVVKATNPASKVTELHTHTMEGGMMKMRPIKQIDIPAKGEAKLEPGGLHVMLIDLKKPLKEGETVPVTLTFEDGSSKQVDATVKMPGGEGQGMKMHGK